MMTKRVFYWKGNEVHFFRCEKYILVNTAQLGRPFGGRKPAKWLVSKSVQDFITALASSLGVEPEEICRVSRQTGTRMHEVLALEYARWLTPALGRWVEERLTEMMTTVDDDPDDPDATTLRQVIRGITGQMTRLQERVTALEDENRELRAAITQKRKTKES